MIKKSLPLIIFVGIGHVINALLGLIFISAAASKLSVQDFGFYMLVTSFLIFIAKITDFGTNNLYISKTLKDETDKSITKVFFGTKAGLYIITIPLTFLLAFVYRLDISNTLVFLLGVFLYMVNFTLYAFFQKHENYKLLILTNFIPAIIKGVYGAILLLGLTQIPSASGFLLVFVFSVIPSLYLIKYLPKEYTKIKLSKEGTKEFFKKAIPAGSSQLINESLSNIANIASQAFGGSFYVGIYSIADKLSAIFSLASLSVFTVLLPKNSLRKKDNLSYDFRETTIISVLILVLAVVAIASVQLFIRFMFAGKFNQSLGIVSILIFAYAFTAIHTFMENYFFVEDKTDKLARVSFTKLIVVVLGSIYLGNLYQLYGIALAQLIGALFAITLTAKYIKQKN